MRSLMRSLMNNNQRTAHRWRLIMVIATGVFVACGSFWLVQLMNQGDEAILGDKRLNEPDYIIDRFSVVRMTKDGKPSYIVAGDKLVHRPIDDSSEIDKPVMRNLGGEHPSMDITAERARVDEGNSRVKLQRNVLVDRAGQGKSAPMRITTEALTVYPDEDRMETDQAVRMEQGGTTLTATGMQANNATRQMQLQGRGTFVSRPQGK